MSLSKKMIAALLVLAAAIVGSAYFMELKGVWLDRFFSDSLSRTLGLQIDLHGSSVTRFSRIRFIRANIGTPTGAPIAEIGSGLLIIKGPAFPAGISGADALLKDITLSKDFIGKTPLRQWGDSTDLRITRFAFSLRRHGDQDHWHVRQLLSSKAKLVGGVITESQKPVRAHGLILIDTRQVPMNNGFGKLLFPLNGERGLRFVFAKNTLKAFGIHGPIFEMRWAF